MAKWIIAQSNNVKPQGPEGVPVAILEILSRRGVSESEMADFLSVMPKTLHDPFLLPDLKETASALIDAAAKNKKICVYGDYDADGITSTALLYSTLKHITDNVCYYVPSRFTDGYGLNNQAIDKLYNDGVQFLITVDCGSTSPLEVEHAKELGMEVIITDHHRLRDGMNPDCLFVNPKRADSVYPFKDLSGCGVTFKLAQGIRTILESQCDYRITKNDILSLLDLVAISTVADVVPLLGENRNLVKYGLDRINKRTRPGLNELISLLGVSDKLIDSSSIAYIIAPNLNALGRMDHADIGVELLDSNAKPERISELANATVNANRDRKSEQEKTYQICMDALSKEDCGEYAPVIYAPGAHEGVAGIVAGNLKESMHRPVCIVTPSGEGALKGTGRSIQSINLHELFENCGDVFIRFGGHAGACGFSLKEECLDEFRSKMQELVRQKVNEDPELLVEPLYIEKELEESEKTIEFAESLKILEPFGEGNMIPVFCIRNAKVSNFFTMGADNQHLRFIAETPDGVQLGCVLFGRADEYKNIVYNGATVDVAGELEVNVFKGNKKLQLKVRDIKRTE